MTTKIIRLASFTPLGTETLNAEGADIQGLEVEFNWLATENFRLSGSASYLNSEFKGFFRPGPDGTREWIRGSGGQ